MKNIKYIIGIFLSISMLFTSCQDDDNELGDLIAPSNIEIIVTYIDDGAESPAPGLGSGEIKVSAKADKATAYQFVIQGQTKLQKSGSVSHTFTTLGTNTYAVTVIAFGTGGVSSTKTIEVEVQALYEPPADLLTMLTSNSSRSWRIAYETPNYFGLGPVGTTRLGEYFPNGGTPDKSTSGMYDDRYIFNSDGTFTHDTGDDGAVFGRNGLINEIGGPGDGTADGDDILKYSYADYSESWTLTAPGGVETLSLSGLGFIGYYIGGSTPHSYKIFARTDNSMSLIATDGNNQFDWNFILIAD
ncbi:glucan endo-1,3-beta-D-glucosidase [Mariniflexile litorale]|uniref:Glucan endo-1,3-beta-D-glucosidase n=1 Tax=Mariniflexile litorale TaxID=3045158 RepID=A0AAU7EJZ9_9FLAO|nr:glucan endo-1,3-beta-D-glucosidase [Mariniflexile sp. KMM 9835]MDQ8211218.1 glucan endo-1,3-beta-D-glucosidase [Mariniflexile sp. KMM 9835]